MLLYWTIIKFDSTHSKYNDTILYCWHQTDFHFIAFFVVDFLRSTSFCLFDWFHLLTYIFLCFLRYMCLCIQKLYDIYCAQYSYIPSISIASQRQTWPNAPSPKILKNFNRCLGKSQRSDFDCEFVLLVDSCDVACKREKNKIMQRISKIDRWNIWNIHYVTKHNIFGCKRMERKISRKKFDEDSDWIKQQKKYIGLS